MIDVVVFDEVFGWYVELFVEVLMEGLYVEFEFFGECFYV